MRHLMNPYLFATWIINYFNKTIVVMDHLIRFTFIQILEPFAHSNTNFWNHLPILQQDHLHDGAIHSNTILWYHLPILQQDHQHDVPYHSNTIILNHLRCAVPFKYQYFEPFGHSSAGPSTRCFLPFKYQ